MPGAKFTKWFTQNRCMNSVCVTKWLTIHNKKPKKPATFVIVRVLIISRFIYAIHALFKEK
jgi:hypothetical protein